MPHQKSSVPPPRDTLSSPADRPAKGQPRPDLMKAALAHAERGWRVFPLRPNDKRPALRADWEGRATTDPTRIRRCWEHGPYNIGIACGPSKLIVIDLDVPKPGERPPAEWASEPGIRDGADVFAALCERHGQPFPFDTYTVRTGRGGMHLYFTAPLGLELRNTAGRLGWLIDTRAHGGYVVAAGSIVAGRAYTVINDAAPTPLPGWLGERLSRLSGVSLPGVHLRSGGTVSDRAAYVRAALQEEAVRVTTARPGGRNHALNKAAYNLGRLVGAGLLGEDVAHAILYAAAAHHFGTGPDPMTPKEATDTIRSGLSAGIRNPRHITTRESAA